jgi:hypothetical protein
MARQRNRIGSKKGKKGKKRQKYFLPFFALLAFFASLLPPSKVV